MYNATIKNAEGNVILSGTGDFRVLAYIATAAKRVLGALDSGTDVSVKASETDGAGNVTKPIVSFTGDPDFAALALSSRVSKLRAALKAQGKETDESEEAPATEEMSDGGPANTEAAEENAEAPTGRRRR